MDQEMSFKGELGEYKLVKTDDQSFTLWSEKFNEHCHSLHGAQAETQHNYISQCRVTEKYSQKGNLTVFEVGLGVGTGLIETLKAITPAAGKKLHFVSSELDEELVRWLKDQFKDMQWSHPSLSSLEREERSGLIYYNCANDHTEITILVGDVRKTLPLAHKLGIVNEVSAVYQDAFSPKNCPILWTTEWFKDLRQVVSTDAILATYSSSSAVRKSILEAGWSIDQFPGAGKKMHGTLAFPHGKTPIELIEKLKRSPVSPLADAAIL